MKYCPECKSALVLRTLDGVERKACADRDCSFVGWDNPVPVVAGLILHEDKLLLAHNRLWPEGVFSMITGYLERHEAPQAAIIREAREELGVETLSAEFIGHYPFIAKNQIIMAFVLTTTGHVNLGNEIDAVESLDLQQVRKKDFGALVLTQQIVNDWLKRCKPA